MLSYQPCLAVRGSIPYDLFFSAKRNVEKRATFTSVRKSVDIRDANSRRETAAGHRAKVRKRRCENRGGLHRHTPNAETAVVGAKKNLRRTRSARIDANKTRVGFG